MFRGLSRRQFSQPQQNQVIDRANPICKDLAFASTGDFTYDAASGSAALVKSVVSGSITGAVTRLGKGLAFTGASAVEGTRAVARNGDLTVLFVGNPTSSSAIKKAFAQSGSAGRIWFAANTDENESGVAGQLTLGLLQTGVNRSSVKAAGAIDGTLSCYLIKKSVGAGAAFKNGVKLSSVTTSTLAGSPTLTTDTISIGGSTSNGSFTFGSDLLLVLVFNRALSDAECASITANPWQVFKKASAVLPVVDEVSAPEGIISADGSSTGSTTVAATSQATAGVAGSSSGVATSSSVGNAIIPSDGAASADSATGAIARAIFFVAGSSTGSGSGTGVGNAIISGEGSGSGSATGTGTTVSITQSSGSSNGTGTTSGTAITLATSNGASSGTATVSGSGYAIWRVDGSSAGIAVVNGEGADGSGGTSNTNGSSTGTSTAIGTARALTQAIAAALGTSNGSGTGAMVIASIGSAPSSSSASAESRSVVNAAGSSSGASTAQGVVIIIAEAVGFAPSAAVVSALTQSIVSTIGQSSGTCTVSGVTEGGVHYIGVGDKFNVTLALAPYAITLNNTGYIATLNN